MKTRFSNEFVIVSDRGKDSTNLRCLNASAALCACYSGQFCAKIRQKGIRIRLRSINQHRQATAGRTSNDITSGAPRASADPPFNLFTHGCSIASFPQLRGRYRCRCPESLQKLWRFWRFAACSPRRLARRRRRPRESTFSKSRSGRCWRSGVISVTAPRPRNSRAG